MREQNNPGPKKNLKIKKQKKKGAGTYVDVVDKGRVGEYGIGTKGRDTKGSHGLKEKGGSFQEHLRPGQKGKIHPGTHRGGQQDLYNGRCKQKGGRTIIDHPDLPEKKRIDAGRHAAWVVTKADGNIYLK